MAVLRTTILRLCVLGLLARLALAGTTAPSVTFKKIPRNVSWQWQLDDDGSITQMPGVTMYDIDMDTAADQIPVLRKAIPGVMVICYISVGTYEKYRSAADKARGILPSDWTSILGKSYSPPFQDEKWIDIRSNVTKTIMTKRFNFAQSIGCDAVEPDNTGAYQENTGFPITKADSLAYSQWIASAVHARNMSVGLKNTQDLIPQLHPLYDWFLNEQCSADNSCGDYSIVDPSKAVLGTEYCDATAQDNGVTQDPGCYCPGLMAQGFNWLIKDTDLDAKMMTCADYCANNPCPGRAGRKNCKMGKANICKAVWASKKTTTTNVFG